MNNNFIDYIDNVKILNNDLGKDHINKINKDLFINDNITSIKIYNNFLLESKKINDTTSYNIDHLICDFKNHDNLRPNIDTYNNFLNKNSNKLYLDNSLIINDAVFLNSFTSMHFFLTHLMFDFTQSINIFYNLLKKYEDYIIILEIIDKFTFYDILSRVPINIGNNLNKLIKFYRDIGLNNKIIIISPSSINQNFDSDSLFIKNLYTISFNEINNIKWLPLLSRFCKNENNEYFSETMKKIIKLKNPINIHFEYHKQKFFILEKRTKCLNNTRSIINDEIFNKIYNICNIYCQYNNLKLIIWEDIINDNSIFEQFNITNNAEIIIGYGGSMWLFNYANTCSKILILNLETEYNREFKILYDMTFYTFINIYKNKSINNIFLHFKNNEDDHLNYEKIINKFLYNFKKEINFIGLINLINNSEYYQRILYEKNITDLDTNYLNNYILKNLELNENNILIDNLNKFEILYEDDNFCIILNTFIIDDTRYIIYNNNLYVDKLPSYKIINKYLNNYIIQEVLYSKIIINNFNNLYGYYLNLISSGNFNYFHFLYETLPYLFSFLKNNKILYNNDYNFNIIINSDFNIIKLLFNLNVVYSNNVDYNIEKLIIPKNNILNYSFSWNKYNISKNEDILNYDYEILIEIRNYIFNRFSIKPECNKNVYLKCNNLFRIFINSDYFIKIINDFNFEIINSENMSFYEQFLYFSQIKTLVCQGGAGMANILFMPENSNVILIISGSKFVNNKFLNNLFIKLNINVNIIYTTPLYLYDNIYKNNIEYILSINLEKHPFNSNLYFNKNNFIYFIALLKKYTNIKKYYFNYSIQINNNILSLYNFYMKNTIDNTISTNIDFDNVNNTSYIYMLLK